jgi:hypothetical protein
MESRASEAALRGGENFLAAVGLMLGPAHGLGDGGGVAHFRWFLVRRTKANERSLAYIGAARRVKAAQSRQASRVRELAIQARDSRRLASK